MSVTTIPLLEDLQGPWSPFRVEIAGAGGETVELRDVHPFTSVTDLKRQIWIHKNGDPRWAPERVFICVRSEAVATSVRPIEFHWPSVVSVDLPDPSTHRAPNEALVDATGARKPISPIMIGSLILEAALSPEILSTGQIPIVTVFCLADLRQDDISLALFGGYYQFYFPWLTAPAQVLDSAMDTTAIKEAYAVTYPYIEDRNGRIELVQKALVAGTVSMNTMVRLRWTLPLPAVKPLSLERTFYGLRATETIPFMRYFPAASTTSQAPLLKLALKPDGTPIIEDAKLYAQYLNQPAPNIKSAVIMARIPLDHAISFILYMFEDGTCDITLEVPVKGTTYLATVANEAQRVLKTVVTSIGFSADTVPLLRDLHATYKWIHPRSTAPLSAERINKRVAALTPFLEVVPSVAKALATFQWRAVSNYESESAQFAYITQMVLRGGDEGDETGPEMMRIYGAELAERFGLTKTAAGALLERWIERRGEAVAPIAKGGGALAVPKFSTGALVSITGTHPEYLLEIQGIDSYEELQRLVSVVGVLLGAPSSALTISAPAPIIQAAAASVAIADAALDEEAEEEEMDPAMAALMADLGIGGGGGEEDDDDEDESDGPGTGPKLTVAEIPVPPPGVEGPAPNLDAAVAAVEEECLGNPWAPGEAALKITPDYYMAKLKKEDKIMFGYSSTATGRIKTYSKSCQRRDDRQPNIMTLSEYARVQRCYEGRVRFVNLPPRKPTDLPQDPKYSATRRVAEDYYYTDHTPGTTLGWPLWAVYGYENKSRPGEFLYLICAELWCDRDNMPLLPAEYEGTQGRGFIKPPMTCPFCRGAAIQDMSKPRSGESVIVRQPKGATGKTHRYIGTITRNKHPNGYELPCCDTTPRLLEKYMKEAFLGKGIADANIDEPEPAPELGLPPAAEGTPIDYLSVIGNMQTQYVLSGGNSLSAGKIGLLSPALDKFFGQDGPRSLEMHGIRPSFKTSKLVFVHMGVDTRLRAPGLNLFAGLAPLLGFESAEACRNHILSQKMVRAFESANYGTLVHEFAAKSTKTEAELRASLANFATLEGYDITEERNKPHLYRLYKAWSAFLSSMASQREPKQLRHLEHMLAQPRVITPRGLLIVTLEQTGTEVQVVCPSFGIPMASIFRDVPVAFMWHDKRDESWEPIILYNGTKDATLFFDAPELSTLPEGHRNAIQAWLKDWRSASLGCGRPSPPPHVWTPNRDTRDLPRLSAFLQKMEGFTPKALVRDRSNRLAGVLLAPDSGSVPLFVPTLDDGNLGEELPRVFEADMIPPAPINAYLQLYAVLSKKHGGIAPVEALSTSKEGEEITIVAFRVAAGTLVPVAPIPEAGFDTIPRKPIEYLPWERDSLILRSPNIAASDRIVMEESTASIEEQIAEAYQYLRLTFSNWLVSSRDPRGPATAAAMHTIMDHYMPLFEKRKRMDILLEPFIREFVAVENTEERKALAILREDCLSLEQEACHGACTWSGDAGGRCLIHVPSKEDAVDPVRVFTARLSDELLRYPSSRREVLNQKVQAIRTPRGAVRIGDELFLATRANESILDRLGFFDNAAVSFPEEMLKFEGMEEEAAQVQDQELEEEAAGPVVLAQEAEAGPGPVIEKEAAVSEKEAVVPEKEAVVPEKEPEEKEKKANDYTILPPSWTAKGLTVVTGATKQDAFAKATRDSIAVVLTARIKRQRKIEKLIGDPERPVIWSIQDWYCIVRNVTSDLLFVTKSSSGSLKINLWIKHTEGKTSNNMYMIFWGDSFVVRGKVYRFYESDLPGDLIAAIGATSPLSDEEAKNSIDGVAGLTNSSESTNSSGSSNSSGSGSSNSSESELSPESLEPEEPKPEEPKPEEPKPEEPKPEEPKPEEPKLEEPKEPGPSIIAQVAAASDGAAEVVSGAVASLADALTSTKLV
jgi:hypothetical protein